MFDYELDHLFTYTVKLQSPEVIGPLPEGIRLNVYITGGEVQGPKIKGKMLPVGGDYLTIRPDGVGSMDIRSTAETEDGALIYASYTGVIDLGPEGYEGTLAGQPMPSGTPFRTAPRFHSAHPDYQWVNRLQCVGIGKAFLERGEAVIDVYAVR